MAFMLRSFVTNSNSQFKEALSQIERNFCIDTKPNGLHIPSDRQKLIAQVRGKTSLQTRVFLLSECYSICTFEKYGTGEIQQQEKEK